ncbi:MAG TPA: preprotein translocase subunit SecY [Spirochaetota bacterium]|nr:preprotein translocase subunit SecY [Spirochaetota bacterium]HQP48064.1 preprotein translocase subunit SecY [Spirochaetota bacterium]
MANVVVNIFKIPELRKKVLFTLFILIIYRIGAHIPIPGINGDALLEYFQRAASAGSAGAAGRGLVDFFDLFAGGALKRFTIFALGIMPYISASIIMQLLTVVIPSLERISKEGPEGQKKINQYTRYGTVVLCAAQSYGLTIWMKSMPRVVPSDSGIWFAITAVMAITTGTMVLMWFGDIITERGIGNGISLLIFAGIVVRVPSALVATATSIEEPILFIILLFIFVLVVAASILLTLGTRRIPVQYGKRVVGRRMVQMTSQAIPLRVNAAGVIPIIFASSVILFPTQIGSIMSNVFSGNQGVGYQFFIYLQTWLQPGHIVYMIFYSALIVFFCYFYTAIQFNPVDIADNLKKYGGFIPGIRPGKNTSDHIMKILNRITLPGSIFLAMIAIVPDIIIRMWPTVNPEMAYLFGGTSLLIIVGVALDTLKQIESQLLMRHYDGFFKKGKIRARK